MYIDSSKHITPEPTPTHTTGLIWITTQTSVIKYWLHQLLQIPCMYSILYLIWNMLQFFFWSKKNLGDLFAEKETKRRPILAKGLLRRPRSPKGDLFGNTAYWTFYPICYCCRSLISKNLKKLFFLIWFKFYILSEIE